MCVLLEHLKSPGCTTIEGMSQKCALKVWKGCRNRLHRLKGLTTPPKQAFWQWMCALAEVTPHYIVVADAPKGELAMKLLEGELLSPLNVRGGPEFVCPAVRNKLSPLEYKQQMLRLAAVTCHIEPHRLWPLQGGSLHLTQCQIAWLYNRMYAHYSGKLEVGCEINKCDIFWAALAALVFDCKFDIGGLCRCTRNGKGRLTNWYEMSMRHAASIGFATQIDHAQLALSGLGNNSSKPTSGHTIDLSKLPAHWWTVPKWLENTDGLLQHRPYMKPLEHQLRKGHQCMYSCSCEECNYLWGLNWQKGFCIWVDRWRRNWRPLTCDHPQNYDHVKVESVTGKVSRYKLPDKLMM